MSDSNLAKISYAKEADWGVKPSVAFTDLRVTGDSLMHGISNIESKELRADRMTSDLIQVGAEVSGGIDFELSFGSPPDDILEGVMFSTFGQAAGGGAAVAMSENTISFAVSDNSMNDSASGFVTAGIRVGQRLRVGNTASNDGWHTVKSVVANKVIFDPDVSTIADESAGTTFTVNGTVNAAGSDVTVAAAGKTYTTGGTINWLDEGLQVGQWVKIAGFTEAANNGYKRVAGVTGTVLTVEQTITDEASGDSITVKGNMIRNGTTRHSFSVQRQLKDIDQFFLFRGCMVNSFDLKAGANDIVTGTVDFMGADIKPSDLAQASHGTGTNVAAPTNSVLNAVTNVGQVMEGSTLAAISSSLLIQEITVKIANGLRSIPAIGVLGAAKVGVGHMGVTGTMNSMFLDQSQYDKFLAGTETGLSFKLEDASGNAYIFTWPRIKYESDDGGKAQGLDQDVVENLGWRSILDSATNCQMQIDKFSA